MNGFFFDFLWVSLHGGGWCVIAVVVSLVVVAKVGFICVDFCFDFFVGFCAWWWWSGSRGGVSDGFFYGASGGGILVVEVVVMGG